MLSYILIYTASSLKCYHKAPGKHSVVLDCEQYSAFTGSKWCQKTNDNDSIFKSCVNDDILEDMQEMFPNVTTADACYNVTDNGHKGSVCMCSTDKCNATSKTRILTILQLFNIICVFFLSFLTFYQG